MLRAIEIVEAGFRTTVEDLGRPAATRHGVPAGGAFDPRALRALNAALGNDAGAAGLEIWMRGPVLVNVGTEPIALALAGAGFGWELMRDGLPRAMPPDAALSLRPRERLAIRAPARGGRGWLGLAGGVDVPRVLGSRSTCLAAGFGGFAGRALRAGDRLAIGPNQGSLVLGQRRAIEAVPNLDGTMVLRVLPGPQAAALAPKDLPMLMGAHWRVSESCDRIGVRLEPEEPGVAPCVGVPGGIEPEGTTLGALQLPPDGRPVLLGPDRPATGGYAKPLLVARVDLGRMASLVPGDRLRFVAISLDEALALLAAAST